MLRPIWHLDNRGIGGYTHRLVGESEVLATDSIIRFSVQGQRQVGRQRLFAG